MIYVLYLSIQVSSSAAIYCRCCCPRKITFSEFIDGAARLRGGAKALDIWRAPG